MICGGSIILRYYVYQRRPLSRYLRGCDDELLHHACSADEAGACCKNSCPAHMKTVVSGGNSAFLIAGVFLLLFMRIMHSVMILV